MQSGFGRTPPVNVGEEYDVQVEAVGEKGDGVVKVKGFVLFVPGVKQGENIKIRINKVLSKVGFAEKIGAATPKDVAAEDIPDVEPEAETSYEDTEDFGDDTKASEDFGEDEDSEVEDVDETSQDDEEKKE